MSRLKLSGSLVITGAVLLVTLIAMPHYTYAIEDKVVILTTKVTERNGPVVYSYQEGDKDHSMIITGHGKIIRLKVADISVTGRDTKELRCSI